jgi:hypothetical protein
MSKRRPFIARPVYRDYMVGCLVLGAGFIFVGPGSPLPVVVCFASMAIGAGILLWAVSWSLCSAFKQIRGRA